MQHSYRNLTGARPIATAGLLVHSICRTSSNRLPLCSLPVSIRLITIYVDQEDESLNRWKASLGLSTAPAKAVDPNDKRRCVIKALALEVEGRPDIVVDLTAPGSLAALKSKPFIIKEAARFRMRANFVVQHDVLSGLKYIQVVKRKGIRVGRDEEMIVSLFHSPSAEGYGH